ncbi:hypothetical protein DAH55_12230 [Sphingomonas koreensis]|uniref:hypothetical protein n=1 Tax=Sphingomonas koreensis TaxID=93064 RepID=UPI00083609C0|nr:hypothetical protein [Sphingomonas koreensis]PJI90890.1 hypothetical protein BDW16_4240 [Sphingomonas koreensis]RSU60143.1 hypothetical protein DAH56_09390 [Sphingomonas koreensis]RSU68083.1 hypothetical protein DAH55_12230 [Sphingomonas koreensis]
MKRALLLLAALGTALVIPAANATKPVKPNELKVDHQLGYIVIAVHPQSDIPFIYLNRLDPTTGKLVWKYGLGSPGSSKNLDVAQITKGRAWATNAHGSFFVIPVTPGRWVIGGTGDHGGETALSLGSYGFDIEPGKFTYVGRVSGSWENGKAKDTRLQAAKLSDDLVRFGTLMNIVMSFTIVHDEPNASDAIPADLQARGVTIAPIIADVRFDNAFRGLVSRAADLPPIRSRAAEAP